MKKTITVLFISLLGFVGCDNPEVKIPELLEEDADSEFVAKVVEDGDLKVVVESSEPQDDEIIRDIVLSDLPPNECNEPMGVMRSADAGHAVVMLDGNVSFWGDAYVAVEVNPTFNAEGMQVQWFKGETDVNPQSQEDFENPGSIDRYVKKWHLNSTEEKLTTSKSCNGKLYLHLMTPSLESGFGVMGTWLEPRKIVVLLHGEVVGEKEFYFQQ